MPGFSESNITLDFPDNNFFRFSTCTGYTTLSGNNFKEMDTCWFDAEKNLYWLIELKDFSLANITTAETIEQKSWDIVRKSIDSLCMFLSSRHRYQYAFNFINPCLPSLPSEKTQFKFITIIHCDKSQWADVQLIHNKFRNKFKPYAELFGIDYYAVIEHSSAIRIIPNNMIR